MAVDREELKVGAKGKAVYVLHTFGDGLWEMGCKSDPPESFEASSIPASSVDESDRPGEAGPPTETRRTEQANDNDPSNTEGTSQQEATPPASSPEMTPQGRHGSSIRH